jgi:tetratricopeptide (TPR) repeat protein
LALAQNDLARALVRLDEALKRSSPRTRLRATLICERGRILHRQQQFEAALKCYEDALQERKDCVDAHRCRGLVLMDLNRFQEAASAFDQYLETSPLLVQALTSPQSRAAARKAPQLLGGVQDVSFRPSAELDPRRSLAAFYRDRGLCRLQIADRLGALEDFARARELVADVEAFTPADRGQFAIMHLHRGSIYLLDSTQLALDDFEAGIAIDPNQAALYSGRGLAYAKMGDHVKAAADADLSLRLAAGDPRVGYNAACIYAQCAALVLAKADSEQARKDSQQFAQKSIDALRRSLENGGDAAKTYSREAERDHALDSIRQTEAFKELLSKFRGL